MVYDLVRTLRGVVGCDIGMSPIFHLHAGPTNTIQKRISTTTPAAQLQMPSQLLREVPRMWTPASSELERVRTPFLPPPYGG